MDHKTQAYVIQIGNRFFYKISKGAVYTACTLAGGKFFHSQSHPNFLRVMKHFIAKGIIHSIKIVELQP